MLTYVVRRLLIVIPMALVISFLIYLALDLTPGDAVSHMISPEHTTDPAKLAELRHKLGLDGSVFTRYWMWLSGVVQGNFGYTLTGGAPISGVLASRLPATLELSGTALVLSSYTSYWDHIPNLVMPALVLSIMMTAGVMRYARSSMLDALSREFIKTARSKGLPEWRVNLLHGFRVALTPVIVLVGFRLPILIGGSVIVEQVFQWPGLGNLFVTSVGNKDLPVVMTIALLSVVLVLVVSLLIDVLTAVIDPRVRLET